MRSIERARTTVINYLPLVATVATLAPIAGAAQIGVGIVVLGAAVSLTGRQRDRAPDGVAATLVRVLTTIVGIAVLAALFHRSLLLGDLAYVVTLFAARLAGRLGARSAAIGRAVLLPLTALFIAPPVAIHSDPIAAIGWSALACAVAIAWTLVIARLIPRARPRTDEVARAARLAARVDAETPAGVRATARLAETALALDAALARAEGARRSPGRAAGEARRALVQVELAVERAHRADTGPQSVESALAQLDSAVRRIAAVPKRDKAAGEGSPEGATARQPDDTAAEDGAADDGAVPEDGAGTDPADAPSARARTRLAVGSALSVTLALLLGQATLYAHWPWAVVTVITVSLGARSRGEVIVRSGQRLLGALAATAVASPLAALLAPYRVVTVVLMLAILGVGVYLRERSYVYWAMAMTATLALLYGLLGAGSSAALLGQRLLAICLGGACAILPALLLAPRTRDLMRKRAATCLRALGACLDARPTIEQVRRFDTAVAELRQVSRPFRFVNRLPLPAAAPLVRQVRRRPELAWADTLAGCAPTLRGLTATLEGPANPDDPAAGQLRRVLKQVAAEVRATA